MRKCIVLMGLVICSVLQAQDNVNYEREFTMALARGEVENAETYIRRGLVDPEVGRQTAMLQQYTGDFAPIRLLIAYGVTFTSDQLKQPVQNELYALRVHGEALQNIIPSTSGRGTLLTLAKMALGQGYITSIDQLTTYSKIDINRGELLLHAIVLSQLKLGDDNEVLRRFISRFNNQSDFEDVVFNMLNTVAGYIVENTVTPQVVSFIIQNYKESIKQFRDVEGNTFLHYFAYNQNSDMIKLVPEVGKLLVQVDMNLKNNDDKTPETIAQDQLNSKFIVVFNLYQAFSSLEYSTSQAYNIMRTQFNASEDQANNIIMKYFNQIPYGQVIDVQSINNKSWNMVDTILQQSS